MPDSVIRLLEIREDPLVVDEVLKCVDDPRAGGINLFNGVVRDHDRGRGVDHLDYTAHPSALQRLQQVAEEVVREYDVVALAAVHRIGRLTVGDSAVLLAVAAAHRDQAYLASRALIDRLKAEVPIWKHQVFTDGDDEWVATP